jgi:regulator of cell morphogenesis and NO signaling
MVRGQAQELEKLLRDAIQDTKGLRGASLEVMGDEFPAFLTELRQQFCREEDELFPQLRELAALNEPESEASDVFGAVITSVHHEHEAAYETCRRLNARGRELSSASEPASPLEHFCAKLQTFTSKLQQHIQVEETLLIPKARRLQEALQERI